MVRTEVVAYFTPLSLRSSSSGIVHCAICPWKTNVGAERAFPAADDAVERHLATIHPNHVNDAGVQKTPRSEMSDGFDGEPWADADLIYYILVPNT
jgi:hypothetical protein